MSFRRVRWVRIGSFLAAVVLSSMAWAQVEPPTVDETVLPGDTIMVPKEVCTPEVLPSPRIYFLADNTGSMGPAIAAVQADAAAVLGAIQAADSTAQFGAGYYRDFPGVPDSAFMNQAAITDDGGAAALGAIAAWSASGGGDGSEAQFFALDQIAELTWPNGASSRIVVWFGDAPAHDPVCSAISGLGYDITEDSVTQKLVDAEIRVVAISTTTGFYANGLNDDPALNAFDYSGTCAIGGSSGQADRIAAATGGVALTNVPPEDIADAILEGISALPAVVTHEVTCSEGVAVALEPESVEVTSGECAEFDETIEVTLDPEDGCDQQLTCTVQFLINGQPVLDEDGNVKPEFTQKVIITVPDVVPPMVDCVEGVNPHGDNVPPAGSTTLPGNKGGQNEDGFYRLLASDNCDPPEDVAIFVVDEGSGTVFGPFTPGDVVKYTQANGAPPGMKTIGSGNNGQAGAVTAHITGNGDMAVFAVDTSGNESDMVSCLVPPPPK